MIVVRDVFQLKFGKAKEAIGLLKEQPEVLKRSGYPPQRILADVTGEYYTLVMESTFNDLAAFEAALKGLSQDAEWQAFYARFTPLVESGRREVFRVVE